jgi:hypothetical protein
MSGDRFVGTVRRVRLDFNRHPEYGWRWRLLLLEGAGPTERYLAVVAEGVAPELNSATVRAYSAWRLLASDYPPGAFELENKEDGLTRAARALALSLASVKLDDEASQALAVLRSRLGMVP